MYVMLQSGPLYKKCLWDSVHVSVVEEQYSKFLALQRMKRIFLMHDNYGSMMRDQWNPPKKKTRWVIASLCGMWGGNVTTYKRESVHFSFKRKSTIPYKRKFKEYLSCIPLCSVSDPDPDWIRFQSGHWIRIQEGKYDPQK
jgi:hypothetical protein